MGGADGRGGGGWAVVVLGSNILVDVGVGLEDDLGDWDWHRLSLWGRARVLVGGGG